MKRSVLLFGTVVLLVLATLAAAGHSAAARGTARVPVLIGFSSLPGPAEEALVRRAGGDVSHTFHLVPAIAATVPETAVAGLRANPHVTGVFPDGQVQAIDTELDSSWGVRRIGAGGVHSGGNAGSGVKVAIVDTGVDYTHPDLDANYAGGYDFVNEDADPRDDHGHGTHVAGIACAEDNGAGVVGVAPACNLYALKVLSSSGSGSWSDIIAALEWAVDNGVQVANLSLGSSQNPGGVVEQAFNNASAAGVVIVAAAGNSGNQRGSGDKVEYPARYGSVIAVAATDSTDTRAYFSSTGDAVELAAPGVSVTSTWLGGGYRSASGTSMASPHVAGTAALVIGSGVTDAAQVRQRLQQTADDLGAAGRDPWYGFGLVDAAEAAASVGPANSAPAVTILSPADGAVFNPGESIAFAGSGTDVEDGDVTAGLVWTSDRDGTIGTGGSFSAVLSEGTHTITAAVVDSGGLQGTATITLTVGEPPAVATTVSVASISYATEGGKNSDRHLRATVSLVDNLGGPVAGATVGIRLDTSTGSSWTGSGTTGSGGTVTFTLKNAPSGTYTTTVTAVTASGLAWDGLTPANSFTK